MLKKSAYTDSILVPTEPIVWLYFWAGKIFVGGFSPGDFELLYKVQNLVKTVLQNSSIIVLLRICTNLEWNMVYIDNSCCVHIKLLRNQIFMYT